MNKRKNTPQEIHESDRIDNVKLRAYIKERSEANIHPAIKKLGLKSVDNLGEIVEKVGLDTKELSGRKIELENDIFKILDVSAAFDKTNRNSDWDLTKKTAQVLEATKNAGGERGLRTALTAFHEKLRFSPEGFPAMVETGYHSLPTNR